MPLFIAQLIITLVLIGMIFNILERFHGRISINFASAATTKFCKWVQVGIDVYIPHLKLQVKLHWSLWFSAACPAVIAHRNHLFCLCQQSKFYASKVKFRQLCPLYLMALCCLLHLIKKNCLLKTFLRTLVDLVGSFYFSFLSKQLSFMLLIFFFLVTPCLLVAVQPSLSKFN